MAKTHAPNLCGIDDIFNALLVGEAEATAAGKGSLIKARADMLAMFAFHDGRELLDARGIRPPAGDALGDACELVRRGVSAPRAARLAGLDAQDPIVRDSLMHAEDMRAAETELALFSRVTLDTSSGSLASLKAWGETLETLTVSEGRRAFTLQDLILDSPELARMVVERYGAALGPIPGERI